MLISFYWLNMKLECGGCAASAAIQNCRKILMFLLCKFVHTYQAEKSLQQSSTEQQWSNSTQAGMKSSDLQTQRINWLFFILYVRYNFTKKPRMCNFPFHNIPKSRYNNAAAISKRQHKSAMLNSKYNHYNV